MGKTKTICSLCILICKQMLGQTYNERPPEFTQWVTLGAKSSKLNF